MASFVKKIRYRLERAALAAAQRYVHGLTREQCHRLGGRAGSLLATFDFAGRRVAHANLKAAFGDAFSWWKRRRIARESYRHFLRTMIDLLWSERMTPENSQQWYDAHDLESVLAEIVPGRSVIFVTFHYSNFEWAAQTLGWHGLPSLLLAQEFKNPLLDPIFNRLRTHGCTETAPRAGGLIRMYKALRRGKHVAVLIDLTLKPREPCVAIETFGLKKAVTFAHAWLHQKTGAPIVPGYCESLGAGRYRLHVERPVEIPEGASLAEITQRCWDRLEPVVRQNPAPWIWRYKHWRYDLPGTKKKYPFYAQIGPAFERRLDRARAELDSPGPRS